MPNQQKYRPVSFRPPEADRLWLFAYAAETGRPVNAILTEALQGYRKAAEAAAAVVPARTAKER